MTWRITYNSQDDALVGTILLSKLGPNRGELVVGGTTLSDDLAIPASVVVLNDRQLCGYFDTNLVYDTKSTMT